MTARESKRQTVQRKKTHSFSSAALSARATPLAFAPVAVAVEARALAAQDSWARARSAICFGWQEGVEEARRRNWRWFFGCWGAGEGTREEEEEKEEKEEEEEEENKRGKMKRASDRKRTVCH